MNIKDNWIDVTVGEYVELCQVTSEGHDKTVDMISILTNTDSDIIKKLPLNQFFEMSAKLPFIGTVPDAYMYDRFELDGQEYGRIYEFDYIKTDEFLDIETFRADSIANMHNIAAVIYRPITKSNEDGTYEIAEHTYVGFERRADLFKDKLSITKVYGAQVFFLTFVIECLQISQDYSTAQAQKTPKKTQTSKKKVHQKPMKKSK